MMKKWAWVVFLVGAAAFCFASGQRDSLEFGFAFPYGIEKASESGIEVTTKIPSVALNFSGITYFTERAGLGAYVNIIFPKELKISTLGQTEIIDRSAYHLLMAMDILFGPSFMAYRNRRFSLPVSFGAHFLQMWSVAGTIPEYKVSGSEFGLGANITGEYHFNKTVYVLARFQLTFDFYAITKLTEDRVISITTVKEKNFVKMWEINPTFGIGFSF
jgi:hypothetical protein